MSKATDTHFRFYKRVRGGAIKATAAHFMVDNIHWILFKNYFQHTKCAAVEKKSNQHTETSVCHLYRRHLKCYFTQFIFSNL